MLWFKPLFLVGKPDPGYTVWQLLWMSARQIMMSHRSDEFRERESSLECIMYMQHNQQCNLSSLHLYKFSSIWNISYSGRFCPNLFRPAAQTGHCMIQFHRKTGFHFTSPNLGCTHSTPCIFSDLMFPSFDRHNLWHYTPILRLNDFEADLY